MCTLRALAEEEPMSVHHLDVEKNSGCVVTVSGDADLYAAANVERELVRLVDEGKQSIVVDLTDATFIDSTMLRVLLNVSKRLRPGGGELLVVCREHNIRKIFEITLLDRVFTIFDTREAALAHLGAGTL
jgi:anti-sigma B factor antagonist